MTSLFCSRAESGQRFLNKGECDAVLSGDCCCWTALRVGWLHTARAEAEGERDLCRHFSFPGTFPRTGFLGSEDKRMRKESEGPRAQLPNSAKYFLDFFFKKIGCNKMGEKMNCAGVLPVGEFAAHCICHVPHYKARSHPCWRKGRSSTPQTGTERTCHLLKAC